MQKYFSLVFFRYRSRSGSASSGCIPVFPSFGLLFRCNNQCACLSGVPFQSPCPPFDSPHALRPCSAHDRRVFFLHTPFPIPALRRWRTGLIRLSPAGDGLASASRAWAAFGNIHAYNGGQGLHAYRSATPQRAGVSLFAPVIKPSPEQALRRKPERSAMPSHMVAGAQGRYGAVLFFGTKNPSA